MATMLKKNEHSGKTELCHLFVNFAPTHASQFTHHLLKQQSFEDKHVRRVCEQALVGLVYATGCPEIRAHATALLDSFVVNLTLLSLAHYSNQDEFKLNQYLKTNVFANINGSSTATTGVLVNENRKLDFMLLIDALYAVLCNDDMDCWPVVQRCLLIIIETSEIVSGNQNGELNSFTFLIYPPANVFFLN